MVNARLRIITLFAAGSFLVAWTTLPNPCSAQGCYPQVSPVQAYNYPNNYGYSQPAPNGYYAGYASPRPYKQKCKRKHKHKHRYCRQYY
jgi:hypothetical protein